jgi:hypothetical protein
MGEQFGDELSQGEKDKTRCKQRNGGRQHLRPFLGPQDAEKLINNWGQLNLHVRARFSLEEKDAMTGCQSIRAGGRLPVCI